MHFVSARIGVIKLYTGPRDESNAEQTMRTIERRRKHPLERKIRLDGRFIEIVARLANLLSVVAPIPRLDRQILAAREGHCPQRLAFGSRLCFRGFPHLRKQS